MKQWRRNFGPEKMPLGQRLKVKDKWMQVVGVAKNSNYRNKLETPIPFFYIPLGPESFNSMWPSDSHAT